MRKALRYRLFGLGKMPPRLKEAAAAADVILAAEGLPVWNRVESLKIPGASVGRGSRSAAGSVVITPGRVLASVGTYVILDTSLPPGHGRQELAASADGLRIRFDVSSVTVHGSGSAEIHYRLPLDASVLSHLADGPVQLSHATEALLNPWLGSHTGGRPPHSPG